jgi:hydroxypyruvate reductase
MEHLGKLRADAIAIYRAGVQAADPSAAVHRCLRGIAADRLRVAGEEIAPPGVLRVVAIGKASRAMARAARELLPSDIFREPGIVVTPHDDADPVEGFRVLSSAHPLPDTSGVEAAKAVESYVRGARAGDGLLMLVSGGASALLPAPAEGITLADKIAVTELLMTSGADIHELNTVRKHLSRLKGGGLLRVAHPAATESFILSDVVGDDLSTIASGPTVADPTTFADAADVLRKRGVWEQAPSSVRERFEKGARGEIAETPKPGDAVLQRATNTIVGSNRMSLDAAVACAEGLGYTVEIASQELTGEARTAAGFLAGRSPKAADHPHAVLAGGETTVTVRGDGLGGRNQEMAVAFLLAAEETPQRDLAWVFLSAGTDGIDGPTDAAGAVVDSTTLERARTSGLEPGRFLENNDAYHFLAPSGDLLKTGPSGTNVADLQVFLVGAR